MIFIMLYQVISMFLYLCGSVRSKYKNQITKDVSKTQLFFRMTTFLQYNLVIFLN